MPYYITYNGQVRSIQGEKFTIKPFDTERFGFENWFAYKYDAYAMRDIIEENFPRAFLCLKK